MVEGGAVRASEAAVEITLAPSHTCPEARGPSTTQSLLFHDETGTDEHRGAYCQDQALGLLRNTHGILGNSRNGLGGSHPQAQDRYIILLLLATAGDKDRAVSSGKVLAVLFCVAPPTLTRASGGHCAPVHGKTVPGIPVENA